MPKIEFSRGLGFPEIRSPEDSLSRLALYIANGILYSKDPVNAVNESGNPVPDVVLFKTALHGPSAYRLKLFRVVEMPDKHISEFFVVSIC